MKVKIWAEFDTETHQYSTWNVEGEGIVLEHSGSSYYRILKDGKQIGTVGGYCPGTKQLSQYMDECGHSHISISIDRRSDVTQRKP